MNTILDVISFAVIFGLTFAISTTTVRKIQKKKNGKNKNHSDITRK